MNKKYINISVESILVILLLLLLAISMTILIFQGSLTYKRIIDNKDKQENARIALSYINMRIKQNDVSDHIILSDDIYPEHTVLVINHHSEEEGYVSYIYCSEGYLWECYTDEVFDHHLSTEIIPIEQLEFSYSSQRNQIITTITYGHNDLIYPIEQRTTLRSF